METENLSTASSRFALRSAAELVGDKNRDRIRQQLCHFVQRRFH